MPPPAPAAPSTVERFFQFSLLGMLASGFLALAGSGNLDWASQIALVAALLARAAMISGWLPWDLHKAFDLSTRTLAGCALAAVCFYPLDGWFISGSPLAATLHLAVLLTAFKLVTAKTPRDYLYLKVIAVTELMAAAMLAVNPEFFVFLALFLLFAVAALASGEVRRSVGAHETLARTGQRAFGRRLGITSFVLCGGILTMTAGLFFVLPRAARGALSRFMPDRPRLPGFSSKVTLGDIGRFQQSSRTVMHVRADKDESLAGVRWRGAALSRFDGQTWDNPSFASEQLHVERDGLVILGSAPQRRPGRQIGYQVQMDEMASDTLFFAGTPETIRINLPLIWRAAGGAFHVQGAPSGLVYRAFSFVEYEDAPAILPPGKMDLAGREELVRLPLNLDPRIAALARSMAADAGSAASSSAGSDDSKARAIERHLRHDYTYTLELPSVKVQDPLAYFLFVRKKGHCEYFASSMAVMLRTLGIPSRVVTGFQSGVFNNLTGWQVVRASDAHSWVEAWTSSGGWTVFDPTPSAAEAASDGLLNRVTLLYDAANQFWQDWVLRYDLQRQVVLATRMQQSGRQMRFDWIPDVGPWWEQNRAGARRAAAILMTLAAIAILLVFNGPTLARWWRKRRGVIRARRGEGEASDATLLYQRMLELMEKRGFQKPPWLTPSEFARVLPASETAVLVDDLTAAYNEFRFGGRRDAAPRMLRLLDRLDSID
jgi:transglutaminase-like putative cysteine protease